MTMPNPTLAALREVEREETERMLRWMRYPHDEIPWRLEQGFVGPLADYRDAVAARVRAEVEQEQDTTKAATDRRSADLFLNSIDQRVEARRLQRRSPPTSGERG